MTAEELLMMSDDVETYIADDALVIDAENRIILTPADGLLLGVESDEEAERIKFVCPRIVGDNIDLSTLQLRVIYRNANGDKDFRICTDITIDGENIRFSWSLSRKVTRYKGMVNFIICAIRTQSDGSIKNEWNTTLAEGTVLEGLEVDILEEEFEEPKDIVLQLLGMLDEKATEIKKEIDKYLEKLKIDNNLDVNSENAIQNKVVTEEFIRLSEENAELKSAMTLIQSENLFDESKQTKGYQYYSDGTIHENSIMAISDFIEVDKNRELFFGRRYPGDGVGKATVTNVIEFDENKKYVKGTERVTNIIPDDRTKYIRFSRNLNDQPYGIMLTYDNYATTFVEYEHYYVCIDKEAKKNSTNWYNVNYFGVLESNSAEDNFVALMALLTDVSDSGGGVIYIPRGKYNLKNSGNENYNFNNIEIIGDGIATVLIRWDRFPIFNICGESIKANGKHCKNITFRDIYFNSSQSYTDTMKPIMIFECVSCLRIESCIFNGNGSHLELRETFDSKIISTDFTNSGRRWKSSDVDDATFDVNNVIYNDLQNVSPTVIFASNGAESYNSAIKSTNQILFWGCRFESFTDGVIGVIGSGANGIRFTDCKFESIYSTVPFLMICGSFVASSFENCYFYRPTILFGRDDKKVVDTVPILFFNNNHDISRNKITGNLSLYYNEEDMQKMKVPLIMCGQKTLKNIIELFFEPTNNNGDKYLEEDVNVVSDAYSQNIVNII